MWIFRKTSRPRARAGKNYCTCRYCRDANKIIADKELDVDFKAITFTTYGVFGKATRDLINKLTSEAPDNDFDPWAMAQCCTKPVETCSGC